MFVKDVWRSREGHVGKRSPPPLSGWPSDSTKLTRMAWRMLPNIILYIHPHIVSLSIMLDNSRCRSTAHVNFFFLFVDHDKWVTFVLDSSCFNVTDATTKQHWVTQHCTKNLCCLGCQAAVLCGSCHLEGLYFGTSVKLKLLSMHGRNGCNENHSSPSAPIYC